MQVVLEKAIKWVSDFGFIFCRYMPEILLYLDCMLFVHIKEGFDLNTGIGKLAQKDQQ